MTLAQREKGEACWREEERRKKINYQQGGGEKPGFSQNKKSLWEGRSKRGGREKLDGGKRERKKVAGTEALPSENSRTTNKRREGLLKK